MKEEKITETIDLTKKLEEAKEDIDKINKFLEDVSTYHDKADKLYNELNNKNEYATYVFILRKTKNMFGNISFNQLSYHNKREVMKMFKEAISMYMAKELVDNTKEEKQGNK